MISGGRYAEQRFGEHLVYDDVADDFVPAPEKVKELYDELLRHSAMPLPGSQHEKESEDAARDQG